MADINFVGRLSNLWSGFVSLWITDVEKRHPEIAYQNAIDSMIEKYGRLKSATAAIMRRREEISARLEKERSELAAISADLNAALATGQDELGIVLIQKKNALEASTKVLDQEMEQASTDAQEAKDSLIQVKAEIQKLKDEKDRMLAQMHSAQARLKIQNQLDGLSVDAEVRALDNVREHIRNTVAEAKMGSELRDSDLDVKLARLRQSSGAITARQQLEEMKRARSVQTDTTGKSM
ncbi:MAG: PspA/IM30 family protein [Candidatus Accumulibacter phosphatis]|uniref:PspA/IM30 family protein n=3 Tax=Candidatus Accumulibacter TaxID=327159 RepID=A0A080M510_9PROT|nr:MULTISPECIES: PspA/IM30 family protein [Candidatus Accumulibacter]KFB70089.1 MAG: PspA/IM30 family protein [Candidatus Accumulibacter vicinus]KFB76308.1 MAG: PspA/IM30 family protein [Candidatus Accumulibacter cognatus]MCM8579342.1 PspA/IM30 family protein [Accumulibacter sp.]MCQ1548073.1 PspA/IM30 family protein [Candidatus Accumulibacter phosphatis]QLH48487.1 MAG: PspA/IM30 family protein [Candidatus Accumulibacter cognatus]